MAESLSPSSCWKSPGELVEIPSWGPTQGNSNQKHPNPQSRILHLQEAPPTVMVTQNHTFKNNANSFTKLGNGLGKPLIALGPNVSVKERFSVSSLNSLTARPAASTY